MKLANLLPLRSLVSSFCSSSVFWFSLLILFLPTQLGLHFWPDFTRVLGLRIDYLSPTLYFTDVLISLLLISWARESKAHESVLKWLHSISSLRGGTPFSVINNGTTRQSRTGSPRSPRSLAMTLKKPWLILFFIFLTLNVLLAQVPLLALLKWLRILEFTLLFIYIRNSKFLSSYLPNFLPPLSLSIILVSLIAITQFLLQSSLGGPVWLLGERTFTISTPGIAKVDLCNLFGIWDLKLGHCRMVMRPYSIFSHPNSLAGFLLVSLVILLGYRSHFKSRSPEFSLILKPKFLLQPTIILGIIALFLTFSRTAWLAALSALFFWYVIKLHPKPTKFLTPTFLSRSDKLCLSSCILLSLLSPFALNFFSSFQTPPPQALEYRNHLFTAARSIVLQHPFLGLGISNFIPALPQYLPVSPTLPLLQPVHNIFWLILAETGLLGLSFALWGLFATLRLISTHRQSTLFSLILVAILVTGATDHYWLTLPQNQLLLTVILGLIWQNKSL